MLFLDCYENRNLAISYPLGIDVNFLRETIERLAVCRGMATAIYEGDRLRRLFALSKSTCYAIRTKIKTTVEKLANQSS